MQVRRLGYALGAEVVGADLTRIDDRLIGDLRKAWLGHLVLVIRGQDDLNKDEFVEFAGRFGEVDYGKRYTGQGDTAHAKMMLLTNRPADGKPWNGYVQGQTWHSDLSHSAQPSLGTFALAKVLPGVGGNTLFANQYMAYESLSPKMQA